MSGASIGFIVAGVLFSGCLYLGGIAALLISSVPAQIRAAMGRTPVVIIRQFSHWRGVSRVLAGPGTSPPPRGCLPRIPLSGFYSRGCSPAPYQTIPTRPALFPAAVIGLGFWTALPTFNVCSPSVPICGAPPVG